MWSRGPVMNEARAYHSMCVLGEGFVFAFGGWDGTMTSHSSIERLDARYLLDNL